MSGNEKSITPLPWEDGFIKALHRTGLEGGNGRVHVGIASQMVAISRTTAYNRRGDSPEFRKRWDETVLLCRENERQRRLRRATFLPLPDLKDIQ